MTDLRDMAIVTMIGETAQVRVRLDSAVRIAERYNLLALAESLKKANKSVADVQTSLMELRNEGKQQPRKGDSEAAGAAEEGSTEGADSADGTEGQEGAAGSRRSDAAGH